MKIAMFYAKDYEKPQFEAVNALQKYTRSPDIDCSAERLEQHPLPKDSDAICIFVNYVCDAADHRYTCSWRREVLCYAVRAGFNQVDLKAAKAHGLTVMRVPAYSPELIAEHAVGDDPLVWCATCTTSITARATAISPWTISWDLPCAGGSAGMSAREISAGPRRAFSKGSGCSLLGSDPYPHEEMQRDRHESMSSATRLFRRSDIVVLTAPLTPETRHMVNAETLKLFKKGSGADDEHPWGPADRHQGGHVGARQEPSNTWGISGSMFTRTRRACSSRTSPPRSCRTTPCNCCSRRRTAS